MSFRQARHLAADVQHGWERARRRVAEADKAVEAAHAEVEAARDAVVESSVATAMAAPVTELVPLGARVGVLERAGLTTVAAVAALTRRQLLALRGVGDATADAARTAVATFESRARASVRVLPDPDRPRAADTRLLAALAHYDRLLRTVVPTARELGAEVAALRPRVDRLHSDASVGSLMLSRAKRAEVVEAAQPLAEALDTLNAQVDSLLEALVTAGGENADTAALWRRYEANAADFIAVLDRVTAPSSDRGRRGGRSSGGTAPPGHAIEPPEAPRLPDLRGGLPDEIADAVEEFLLRPGPLVASLRRYQEFGARYLVHQQRALLGDDMGLGKTVQVLAAMCHLHDEGRRRFFVVAPNSVLVNWEREVRKHTELTPFVMHGQGRLAALRAWNAEGGVGITTYGTIGHLVRGLGELDLLAVDEAHYVKNPDALRTRHVTSLAARSGYVTLLTGTALENRLEEFHGLVTLAQPALRDQVALMTGDWAPRPSEVRLRLAPVYLRRTQADVLTELPERVETDELVTPTPVDLAAYWAAPDFIMNKRLAATVGDGRRRSAKYERLSELLDDYREAGRKVVVFSFFRQVLDDVSALAGGCAQITGSVAASQRQRIIDEFSASEGFGVLACQVDAGGLGINLQAAQVVILMEPQMKPSTEQQAIARVHRMGQTRSVSVHRLIAVGTIDEKMVRLVARKMQIFREYAHESSVKDASEMAVDGSSLDIESELQALLAAETKPGSSAG